MMKMVTAVAIATEDGNQLNLVYIQTYICICIYVIGNKKENTN